MKACNAKQVGRPRSAETRAKLSAAQIGRPRSLESVRAGAKAMSRHPNRLERCVLAALIDAFPTAGWKFNDGLVIAGKIPDFIRSDGVKLVVDVHGDYWHRNDTPATCRARQRLFRDAGGSL